MNSAQEYCKLKRETALGEVKNISLPGLFIHLCYLSDFKHWFDFTE